MKVIFLNTWHAKLRDELRTYVTRHMDSTAVFCFQEAFSFDAESYQGLLDENFVAYSVEKQTGREDIRYANVIYVRKDISIKETGSLFAEDAAEHAPGLATYITLAFHDTELTICNVHGAPYPGDKLDSEARLYQSSAIIKMLQGKHAIIGGDFNLLPNTKSIQTFAEHGYKDLIADYKIQTTRNHITFAKYPDNIQYHADYAFVSSRIGVTDFIVPANVVSDHQPLELSVAIESESILEAVSAAKVIASV